MPMRKRDLQDSLVQKFGFEEVEGSRHDAVSLIVDGRKVATTRFSRGGSEIGDAILTMIARQIWVPLGFLKGMYACTKSREDYLERLRGLGRLS